MNQSMVCDKAAESVFTTSSRILDKELSVLADSISTLVTKIGPVLFPDVPGTLCQEKKSIEPKSDLICWIDELSGRTKSLNEIVCSCIKRCSL